MFKKSVAFFLFFMMGIVQAMELPGMVDEGFVWQNNSAHWLRELLVLPPSLGSSYTLLPSSASSRSLVVQKPAPEPRSNAELKKLILDGNIDEVSFEERERGGHIFKQEDTILKRKIRGNKGAFFGSLLGTCAGLVCIACNEVDDQSEQNSVGLYATKFCLAAVALGSSVLSRLYMGTWRDKLDKTKEILTQLQTLEIKRLDEVH